MDFPAANTGFLQAQWLFDMCLELEFQDKISPAQASTLWWQVGTHGQVWVFQNGQISGKASSLQIRNAVLPGQVISKLVLFKKSPARAEGTSD